MWVTRHVPRGVLLRTGGEIPLFFFTFRRVAYIIVTLYRFSVMTSAARCAALYGGEAERKPLSEGICGTEGG